MSDTTDEAIARELAEKYANAYAGETRPKHLREVFSAAIREALAQQQAELSRLREAERWIPISEQLPKDEHSVLLAVSGMALTLGWLKNSSLTEGREWRFNGLERESSRHRVTHWRPLPSPPSTKERNKKP